MFTSQTKWNWEQALVIISALDVFLESTNENLVESHKSYLEFSNKTISSIHYLLKEEGVESSLFLLKGKDGESLGTILDCGGEIWSVLGKDGINTTLKYLGYQEKNNEFLELIPLTLNLNDKEDIKKNTLYRDLKKSQLSLEHFSIIKFSEKEEKGYVKYSTYLPYQANFKKDLFLNFENNLSKHNKDFEMSVYGIEDIPALTLEEIQNSYNHCLKYNLDRYSPNLEDREDDTWAMFESSNFCFHISNKNKSLAEHINLVFNETPTHEFLSLTNAPHISSIKNKIPYDRIRVDLSTEQNQKAFIELINFTILAYTPSSLGLRDIKESDKKFSEFSYGIFHTQQIDLKKPALIQQKIFNCDNFIQKLGSLKSPFSNKPYNDFEEILNISKIDQEFKINKNLIINSKQSYGNRF